MSPSTIGRVRRALLGAAAFAVLVAGCTSAPSAPAPVDCAYGDDVYRVGEKRGFSEGPCYYGECVCTVGQSTSTVRTAAWACKAFDLAPSGPCGYFGRARCGSHYVGDSYTSADGCSTCTCELKEGYVSTTIVRCTPRVGPSPWRWSGGSEDIPESCLDGGASDAIADDADTDAALDDGGDASDG